MGVYIPNMEMPKGSHEIIVRIQSDGRVLDQYGHRFNLELIAVPVPPHGRLIDADAYESLLRGTGSREYRREKGTICDAIKFLHPHYAPTIIPAEEGGA